MHKVQAEAFRHMTPAQKLDVAGQLYTAAWELKAAGLRSQHPAWSEAEVAAEVRRIFLRAHT
jgi:hypothetical protein